jgi:prophage maintenance system killer protein
MDEEWPCGERLFDIDDEFVGNADIQVTEYLLQETKLPSVISTFENAEGWYPQNGVFVGDCMPYVKDGEYHVLYLKDRHHHKSKWGMGAHQWEHISTKDFKTWSVHPMAVSITSEEEGSICTGSWIRDGKREYLYYTVRRKRGLPAIIARSVSEDGYHFEKDKSFGSSIGAIYQTAFGKDVYPTTLEKSAHLLYFLTKNHSFVDGNKRIAAAIFVYFMHKNNMLYNTDHTKRIADQTLVALTVMVAQSRPEEKDLMIDLIINLIK